MILPSPLNNGPRFSDTNHKHAVASGGSNTYGYDQNGNMTSRTVNGQSYTLTYDAENRLVSVTGAATANFYYDADGKRVKSVVNGETTLFVGAHYELTGSTVTKYYFAGASRIAMRKYVIPQNMMVELTSCISRPTLENISYAKAYCALSSALLQEV